MLASLITLSAQPVKRKASDTRALSYPPGNCDIIYSNIYSLKLKKMITKK